MGLFSRKHPVADMVGEYLAQADRCTVEFGAAMQIFLREGPGAAFSDKVHVVDQLESECDTARRGILSAMFRRELIPESRTDILKLIEHLDGIPNRCERICYDALVLQLSVPANCTESYRNLVFLSLDCWGYLAKAVHALFGDMSLIEALVDHVDQKESESDVLRRELVRRIFSDPAIAPDQRILLRDFAEKISGMSDRCEKVGDLLTLLTIKRLV